MAGSQPWDEHDFVFVGGMHRSGTTLLANAIGSAASASGLTGTGVRMDEGQFLQDVYPVGRALGGVTGWAFDERAYLDEKAAAATPDALARLWTSWSPFWDLSSRHLVEKTPLNLTKTRFLQAVFPRSKFVVITRHPITQALAVRKWSPANRRKWGYDFPVLIEHWLRAHEAFRQDSAALGSVHVVRFEDVMSEPQRQLERIQEFLGFAIPGDHLARVDHSRASQYAREWSDTVARGGLARGLAALGRPANFGTKRAIRNALKRPTELALFSRYARRISRDYAERVRALGYDVDDLDVVAPWPGRASSVG